MCTDCLFLTYDRVCDMVISEFDYVNANAKKH